ncbi:putative collagen-binding domain-containing protein [Paenarthrobacter sp. NPDC091669]|uniref:putative collagen-binding domain-containing protein n=1 Tax=Paenarthrobacter sp. NPDC091669 TaxID=3364384 RepID=UPI0038016D3B
MLPTAYKLRWFDPRTGDYAVVAEDVEPLAGRIDGPPKPTTNDDWILIAEVQDPSDGPS